MTIDVTRPLGDIPVSRPLVELNKRQLIHGLHVAGLVVPSHFVSDGASIPQLISGILRRLLGGPFEPRFERAAWFHDWVYRTPSVRMTRKEADDTFRALLLNDGVSADSARIMWAGVRVFGASSWEKR